MPIDPKLLFQQKPLQLPSRAERLQGMLSLRNLIQQSQLNDQSIQQNQLALQQKQQLDAKAQRINALLADHLAQGGSLEDPDLVKKIYAVDANLGAAYAKAYQDRAKDQADIDEKKATTAEKRATTDKLKREGEQAETDRRQKRLTNFAESLKTMPADRVKAAYRMAAPDLAKQLGTEEAPADLEAFEQQTGMSLADYLATQVGPQKPDLMNVPAGNSVIDKNNPSKAPVYTAPAAPKAPTFVRTAEGVMQVDPSAPNGLKKVGSLPPTAAQAAANAPAVTIKDGSREFTIAQDLAYGKLTFPAFQSLYGRAQSNAPLKTAIYEKARELNPNFNPAAFEMGFKLASNPKMQQQLASLDNVKRSVADLIRLSDEAGRTGSPVLNQYIIKGGVALGDKRYSNLKAATIAFADELSGALGFGSATDMSRQMGLDLTDDTLSPDQFRSAVLDVVVPFIDRKKQSFLDQMGVYGQPGMNAAATQQPATKGPTVRLKAPDGTEQDVPAADVGHYLSKGAKVVVATKP